MKFLVEGCEGWYNFRDQNHKTHIDAHGCDGNNIIPVDGETVFLWNRGSLAISRVINGQGWDFGPWDLGLRQEFGILSVTFSPSSSNNWEKYCSSRVSRLLKFRVMIQNIIPRRVVCNSELNLRLLSQTRVTNMEWFCGIVMSIFLGSKSNFFAGVDRFLVKVVLW